MEIQTSMGILITLNLKDLSARCETRQSQVISPWGELKILVSSISDLDWRRHPAEKQSKQATGEAKVGEPMKPTKLGKLAQQALIQNAQV